MADNVKNEAGLLPKQQAFCDHYVQIMAHGERAEKVRAQTLAALRAGYSDTGGSAHVIASRMLKLKHIRAEIRRQSEDMFHEALPLAVATIIELSMTGTAASRMAAATRIADQSGLQVVAKSESKLEVTHNMSLADVRRRIQELQSARKDPQLPPPAIEADFEEVPERENLNLPVSETRETFPDGNADMEIPQDGW